MKLLNLIGFAVINFTLASGAFAQETGTLLTNRSAEIEGRGPDAARRTMEAFMACLVSRYTGRAIALAAVPVDSAQYDRLARNMYENAGDQCLAGGGRLSFSGNLFRGGLFQALYERQFRDDAPMDFSAVESTGYRQLYPADLSAEARTALALEHFGECVARADPEGVRSLISQQAGTSTEAQAITELRPRLAACIPQDNTIRFSAAVLKGALAEGIYRLSVAHQASAGGSN